ncbi:DUF6328 family protein [Streptomyces apricus]|uniref:Uncharacterized protein n=1 Tax=Streptomyces apricus TaxID=1828112 RepID=A0A5B0BFP6_9ACTN|nr:DUF6328 family protein [Streptomyces apricus]KAA0940416.1 hypothetical protein FGF04_10030 [Streptomyces apricus]
MAVTDPAAPARQDASGPTATGGAARPEDSRATDPAHRGAGAQAEDPEGPRERMNRRWNELLQETRVAQTGVQILFGFLLSVAFTAGFRELGTIDRTIYVTTVVLGAAATGSLIAPVSIHRFLAGQSMKDELVETAHKLMMFGMVLLALTIGSTLLLILRVVLPGIVAEVLVAGVMLYFGVCWYALPLWLRRRASRDEKA